MGSNPSTYNYWYQVGGGPRGARGEPWGCGGVGATLTTPPLSLQQHGYGAYSYQTPWNYNQYYSQS